MKLILNFFEDVKPKTMLKVDIACAFFGAGFFILLFDFIQTFFGLPRNIVLFQLGANTMYGVVGLAIFFMNCNKIKSFRYLIGMNFVTPKYALVS